MSRQSILIVEDDVESTGTFETMLRTLGYLVRTARDAESGLAEIDRDAPSLALVDLHLPLADGVEFVRRVRAHSRESSLPVAVVTGDYLVDEQVTAELHALGAPLHFKPLWQEDLLEIVAALLASRGNCRIAAK